MDEFRTIATFGSARFPPPDDDLVSASHPLVNWLVEGLRTSTGFHVHPAESEDWGTFVRVEEGRAEYQLNVAVGDQWPPTWWLEVQVPRGLLKRVLRVEDPDVQRRIIAAVHLVLRSDPGTNDLRWHLGTAFGRGDRSTGASAPDKVPEL
jgi:hypothetical protein